VQKRILSITKAAFLFSTLLITGCSKLDTTDIGSDLLPAVDNVNTFETLLTINTSQGIFNDSTLISSSEDHVLGKINNDPLFGTTTANIFAQFKPTFYPYYFGNSGDTIVAFDSVVLCLSYKGFWGDSTIPLQLEVREIPKNAGGLWDSTNQFRHINYAPPTTSVIGSKLVDVKTLGNYVVYTNKKDSVKNQVRIKLSSAFANSLFARDSLLSGNQTFRSDSLFRVFQNGLAIMATGSGNGLLYTNLTDSTTKLEVHFRRKNGGTVDTTFSSFKMLTLTTATTAASITANNIIRNRTGSPSANPSPNDIYLQTTPGTFADLSIPSLDTLSNKIIHRAEIIVEQVPNNILYDSLFSAPDFLYVDLKDTGTTSTGATKWKPLYFDLNPSVSYNPDNIFNFYPGNIDYFYHGGYVSTKTGALGNAIKFYNFNITRYVQQVITKKIRNYNLRLYAPYELIYKQYSSGGIPVNNRIAKGRIKVGSGANANYRMRLRLVYSKI
jgi:hypothetical protein